MVIMVIMVIKKASYFNALELRSTAYNYAFTENKIIALLSL